MKVSLLFFTSLMLAVKSYSIVGSSKSRTRDLPLQLTAYKSTSLCKDENGQPIEGLARYKLDCRKFVQCLSGKAFIFDCPKGLLFSEEKQNCGWPRTTICEEFMAKEPPKLVIPIEDVKW